MVGMIVETAGFHDPHRCGLDRPMPARGAASPSLRSRRSAKVVACAVAATFPLGGLAPAVVILLAALLMHLARSPERLLDALYAAVFCGLGYLAG